MLRILFLGDIVGEPGRKAVIGSLKRFKEERAVDFIIVNGENSAGGRGITPRISIDLLRAGAAVITSGDHIWDQKEVIPYLDLEPRLLRPLNYPPDTPGHGAIVLDTPKGPVGVINVQGRTFMQPSLENPFLAMETEVEKMLTQTPVIFVDVHAETTSEKIAMGRFLDGRVSAVVGTHTHTQTADDQVFPGGTAFLCDAGMCGPSESCLGREIDPIIQRFLTSRAKTVTQTVKFLDIKQACIENEKDIIADNLNFPIKIEETKETKKIIGLESHKIKVTMANDPTVTFDAWYTTELGMPDCNSLNPYAQIKGVLLDYRVKKMGLEMHFLATSRKKVEVSEDTFEVPSSMKIVNKETMAKVFSN